MAEISKKNAAVRDQMIAIIKKRGFVSDACENYKNGAGDRRFKFNATSYRLEVKINTKPVSWMRAAGDYYKDVIFNGD